MTEANVTELQAEIQRLKSELDSRAKVAARAIASYQQRALQMEIIRQQNEDLDRLAADLSKAKKLEEERARDIEAAARLKSEFLANFSHEIRTPLNGILGYCDLLSREEGSRLTAHGRRDLNVIKSNAKTLLSLINDILDLSKIEAGRVDVVKEQVDLAGLIDECTATIREYLKGKDVTLTKNVAPSATTVFTDPLKLRQIILNLLSNAAKFTDNGEISITATDHGADLRLEIEDTGTGIPADQLPFIFEKFRQVDGSSTRKVGGTGLGLAIVRELSKLLGGGATVVSALGRGSRFTVTIGAAIDGGRVRTQRVASDAPAMIAAAQGATVLIVDDDPLVQQLLGGELEREGFRVVVCTDGVSALRAARERRPAAILLDIHLPKLHGWDVLTELKSDVQLSGIPVIIISVEEQRARGYSLGACEYLVKPVEPEQLVSVVRRSISPSSGEVLVVDDDGDSRQLVLRNLQAAGFKAAEARDGDDALLRVRVSPPALLILDLVMPNIDGFEVLRRLRADGCTVPVVVLTGKDLTKDEERDLRDAMVRVVHKGGLALDEVVSEAKRLVMEQRTIHAAKLPRILYVEDAPQNRDIVRRYLAGDFEVLEAEDGEHGLERAAREVPDLILMDLSLPRVDGWTATQRLKENPKLRDIPVIALTAHAGREDQERARKAGCSDFLTKPVAREDLLAAIRRHLSARWAHA